MSESDDCPKCIFEICDDHVFIRPKKIGSPLMNVSDHKERVAALETRNEELSELGKDYRKASEEYARCLDLEQKKNNQLTSNLSYMAAKEIEQASSWLGRIQELETDIEKFKNRLMTVHCEYDEQVRLGNSRILQLEDKCKTLGNQLKDSEFAHAAAHAELNSIANKYCKQHTRNHDLEIALKEIYNIAIQGTNKGSIEVTRVIAKLGISK